MQMNRQVNQFCHQGPPGPMGNFSSIGPDEMALYAYIPQPMAFARRAPWPAGMPYATMPASHHPAAFGAPEFFGQDASFVADNGIGDEFTDHM